MEFGSRTSSGPGRASGRSARSAGRSTWWAFFFVIAAMGVVWSLSIPMMGAPDEPAHAIKAVAVARGEFRTGFVRTKSGGFLQLSIPATEVRVPRAYRALGSITNCWLTHESVPASCAPPVGTDESEVTATTYVGTYPPLYYMLVGWPSHLFAPPDAIYAMRIVSALVCACLLASGLVVAARLGRMVLVGAALGITPMVVFLIGSINPNGVEIAAAFCLWLSLIELLTDHARRVSPAALLRSTAAAVLLIGMRPLSPAFAVVIAVVVGLLVVTRAALVRVSSDSGLRVATAMVCAFAVFSAAFVIANHSLGAFIEVDSSVHRSRLSAALDAFHLTGMHLRQAIGVLSWVGPGEVQLPQALVWGWMVVTLLLVVGALVVGSRREQLVLLLTVAGAITLPCLAQAGSATYVGWQGRYGLPILVGIPITAGWVIEHSRRFSARAERTTSTVVIAALAVAYLVAQQQLLTRAVVGLPHALFAGLSGGIWRGPGSPALLFAGVVAASVGYVVLMTWLLFDPLDLSDPAVGTASSPSG